MSCTAVSCSQLVKGQQTKVLLDRAPTCIAILLPSSSRCPKTLRFLLCLPLPTWYATPYRHSSSYPPVTHHSLPSILILGLTLQEFCPDMMAYVMGSHVYMSTIAVIGISLVGWLQLANPFLCLAAADTKDIVQHALCLGHVFRS